MAALKIFSRKHHFKNVSIIGAGLMGSGISQVCAQNNHKVVIYDQNKSSFDQSRSTINKSLERINKKTPIDIKNVLNNISFSDDLDSLKSSDLVIEAITENLETKKQLFVKLDKIIKKDCVFCSNTSSIPITDIAKATTRQDKFFGLHFFNPG